MWLLALAAAVPLLTASDLSRPDGTWLDSGWRFSARDDPSFASLSLDDSSWPAIASSLEGAELPADWKGTGWFRYSFDLDRSAGGRALGLLMTHGGAIEVFVDGRRAFLLDGQHDGPVMELIPAFRGIELGLGSRHVLAVRFSNEEWKPMREVGFLAGFRLSLVHQVFGLERARSQRETSLAVHLFFVGISGALAFLFFLLYLLFRDRPHNLYFAVMNVAHASIELASLAFTHVQSLQMLAWVSIWMTTSVVAISLAMMFTLRTLFFSEIPRWYRWFGVAGGALCLITWVIWIPILYIYSMASLLEGLRLLVLARRQRKEGSLIIGAGFLFIGAGVVVQMLSDVLGPMMEESHSASIGTLGFLTAMCIQLARDFARTHGEKVEQEVENAKKAQALEQAKKLEAAHAELADKHHQLQETQSQLVQSEKMASLGRLVAGLAHEINTPIGAMTSAHDSMTKAKSKLESLIEEKGEALQEDRRLVTSFKVMDDAAKVIEMGAVRVAGIVERLKSFTRLDEAELQRADLHRGIEDALAMAAHELGDRIQIVRRFGELPLVLCKAGQLNQVLLNVLMNAKQAIPDRGTIEISTAVSDGHVAITVKDDGIGIAKDALPSVFEPGFTTKGVGVGMGMGLSIAYRVVKEHGGSIQIASEAGSGTSVTIALPID